MTEPRRVGINLLWMVPGVVGGSETYTTRLLSGLAEHSSPDLDYTLFTLPQFSTAHPEFAAEFDLAFAPVTGQWKSFRVAGENSWLAAQAKLKKIDLLHHAGGTMPLVHSARPVLTIHDLQYLFYPEYFTRTKLTWLRQMVPRSAEAARVILVPSEYTRRTVIERLNIDPSVVIVVPHGISPREPRGPVPDLRERYELDGPIFLYPAASYPHKNHLLLLKAFKELLTLHPRALLVLTGARAYLESVTAKQMEARIGAEIETLGIEASVRRLGFVPSDDLDALYQEAIATVFPSKFEGFGAPVLEAMSRACPVVAANATALPEVVSDNGLLVSPDNAEEWAETMARLIEDDDLRARLSKGGPERARDFTWARSAAILEDAYRHALETTL
ncbi:MAG TPA: glycosyltransferase family 1 protein [Actinomycetota bacterium]|nr:glycosyltransferase family 1 protein [Actinomycetota bacterium]